jgi:hypothetical protein
MPGVGAVGKAPPRVHAARPAVHSRGRQAAPAARRRLARGMVLRLLPAGMPPDRAPEPSLLGPLAARALAVASDALAPLVLSPCGGAGVPQAAACATTRPTSRLEWLPAERLARVTIRLAVRRPDGLPGLAVALDPQHWDLCSRFIRAAWVARAGDGDLRLGADGLPAPEPAPPRPGTPWRALLFEHLAVDLGVRWSEFLHVLAVETEVAPDRYRFTYALHRSLRSRALWDARDGGLDVDQGHAVATPGRDGWIDVEATKALRFTSRPLLTPVLDAWAVVTLARMPAELAETLCCRAGDGAAP